MSDESFSTGDGETAAENEEVAGTADGPTERRWKRGIALTLASLAVLGTWIAVLQTNAATNESRLTREATRLAAEAQSATVVEAGMAATLNQIDAEVATLGNRAAFLPQQDLATELGIESDPEQDSRRLAEAEQTVASVLDAEGSLLFDLQLEGRELTLTQAALVNTRVTWNARASQYETVIAVLAVALFLVGLTAVVARGLRPPLALPGLLLALACFGWALHIYNKPIPNVPEAATTATAEGQTYLENGEVAESLAAFDRAIEADDSYLPAHEGRALASLVLANPDVTQTLAFTYSDADAQADALAALDRALELGGDEDVTTLAVAAFAAIGASDYESAARSLEAAVALNDLTPGLQFVLSGVQVALGNEEAAREWRRRAVDLLGGTDESDRNREIAATYYTVLEKVAEDVPEQLELAQQLRDETVADEAALSADRAMTEAAFPEARFEIREASFEDDQSMIDVGVTGLPADATVTIIGYERPSPSAAFVQPQELFYSGRPLDVLGAPPIETPRACHPVEYRFDFYVESELVESRIVPGGVETC